MREIEVTGSDRPTLVDDEDYDLVSGVSWCLSNCGYVQGWYDGKAVYLHRLVMDAQKGQEIDHINRDKLDNRKENLRFCTRRENMQNREYAKKRFSQYRGVTKHKRGKNWAAVIHFDGKNHWLGVFPTELEAAQAYLDALAKYLQSA